MPTPDDAAVDLTDAEWNRVAPLLPAPAASGRPRTIDLRAVVDAILFLKRTGCPWRDLPSRYPNPSSVRTYHDRWHRDGTLGKICSTLGLV